MSEAVDKLIEANQKAAEEHRLAYGKAMYNKGIQDALEIIKIYDTGEELTPLVTELKTKIAAFKKPS